MDEERERWGQQFNSDFGARELLRFMAAFIGWILLGAFLAAITRLTPISYAFLISAFAFPFSTFYWRPAYRLFRIILGNRNLPEEPMPRSTSKVPREPVPWWLFIPGLWFWALTLAVLYLAIRYFLK